MARVAFFLPSLGGGGAERVMVTIANGMAARGWNVDFVLAHAVGPYLNEIGGGVRVVDLAAGRVLASLLPLARYLRERRPPVMLTTMTHANILAAWARKLAGDRTRLIIRESTDPGAALKEENLFVRFLLLVLMRRWYTQADCIVAPSQGVAGGLVRIARVPERQIEVIFNPVDHAQLRAQAEEPIDHPWFVMGDRPVLLAVGRLAAEKDHATLLRAFAAVRNARPARLLVLGEGPQRRTLQALADSLGLGADVDFPGFVPNPFPYMRQAAVFVLSSRFEGMPNALVQAIALGCRVVATDCPSGPREILRASQCGALVPVGDPVAMAAAVEEALNTTSAPRSRIRLARQFDVDTVVEAYCRLVTALDDEP